MRRLTVLVAMSVGLAVFAAEDQFVDHFDVPKSNFKSSGKNSYCIIEPGYKQTFDGEEDGKKGHLEITVLDQTEAVDGVETRIVEERESADGQLVEVSRNYFAVDSESNDVYYFGEDVDMYKDGKVSDHEGSWRSGKDGAHFGLFMPSSPKLGQKYYQELAPSKAMDRARIVSVSEHVKVAAGDFDKCVKTEETSALETDSKEYKLYAPNVGLLIDGGLKLVKYGQESR